MAALIVSEATGGGCWPPDTIINSDLPRLMLPDKNRTLLFADEDLLGLAGRLLDEALELTPTGSKRFRRPNKPTAAA
jgi:hypothetical protein